MSRRALIVNDVRVAREVIAAQLRALGFEEVVCAADGSEALSLLGENPPDVVISDVHMPLIDGFQLCRLMRSPDFPKLNDLPVVLVSATFRDQSARRLADEVGAQAFLEWPFSAEALGTAVERSRAPPEDGESPAIRVLIADDDDQVRGGIERVLSAAGFRVLAVADGNAAITSAPGFRPHAVICDYVMPGMDGGAVLAWLRAHMPGVPVIMMTALGSERLAVDLMRAGAYDYLPKPFEAQTLPSLIRSALEKFSIKGISRQFGELIDAALRSEARYRVLFESAREPILICGRDGSVLEANETAARLLGLATSSVIGLAARELFVPAEPRHGADVLAALQQRGDASIEAFLTAPGRRPLPVELSGAILHVGGAEQWLLVVRDLSDRKWIGAFVRHEHQFLKQLHRTTRLIDSEAGFSAFLEDTLRGVLTLLDMDAGVIASPSWGRASFDPAAGADRAFTVEGGVPEGLARSIVDGLLTATGPPRNDTEEIEVRIEPPESLGASERSVGLRTRVTVELASRYGRYGLLVLWRRGPHPVHERDATLTRSIASHLALAIENAALFASVSRAQDDWQRTFDAVDDAVLVLDAAGCVARINQSAAQRLKKAPDEIIGRDARTLLFGDGGAAADQGLFDLTPGAAASRRSIEGTVPGLGRGTFDVSIAPLFTQAGEHRGAAVVVRDVTAERRAQQQLMISEKMSTIGRMAAGVTHEINNPAAFVLLNVSHLQERLEALQRLFEEYGAALLARGGEEALKALKAREEALGLTGLLPDLTGLAAESLEGMQRIRDITQELRLFSRVRESDPQDFDLNTVIDSAVAIARHQVRHRGRLVREPTPLPLLRGDSARMTQVFVNLLVNAAQAIPEGHAYQHVVAVRTSVVDGRICAEVSDTGQGIAPEDLSRIFEPFFTTKEPGMGTGLGLALCYEIVRAHGGEIEVESELGKGSTLRVWLPVGAAAPPEGPRVAPAEEAIPQQPARILIIEDEPGLRRAVRRVLREHALEFAVSGREAIDLLKVDRAFDAIVCDVVMPDVSGVEVFEWLRANHPELVERFAFVTGGVRREDDLPLVRASGRPVIEKPVDVSLLRRLIEQLRPK